MQRVAFGGGCHWCTEAIFQSLRGVKQVEQGWVNSSLEEASTMSEAVIVYFDPLLITLNTLIEVHLFTHNATSNHAFRAKYRSAVYTFSSQQQRQAEKILSQKAELFTKPLITKAYPFKEFKLNEEKYLNYYKKNSEKPFCQMRIEPKLKILLEKFSDFLD